MSEYSVWNTNGIIFANSSTVGSGPCAIFIDRNNTIYAANRPYGRIQIWSAGNSTLSKTITGGFSWSASIFVNSMGEIYLDYGSNYQVLKVYNTTFKQSVMYVKWYCYGLFLDLNNTLYCSLEYYHQVVTKSLDEDSTLWTVVAGTTCSGSTSNSLRNPHGIYVDESFSLYVADCGNNRIQKFLSNQPAGITLTEQSISLNCPTGVILDSNQFLFIVDSYNNRIIRSSSFGFFCIIGCQGGGAQTNQLAFPESLAFDSFGNIFITDKNNSRIMKFILTNDTLGSFIDI